MSKNNQQQLNKIWYKGASIPFRYTLLSNIFKMVSGLRKKLFDIGVLKKHKVKCPVVIVGNISVGGSG